MGSEDETFSIPTVPVELSMVLHLGFQLLS